MSEAPPETVRLDVWLFRARFYKSRGLAGEAISKRGVRITRFNQTRRTDKPSSTLFVGDVLTFAKGSHIEVIEVLALGHRRGPASEAQSLYVRQEGKDV